jgi:hypothetical protein
MPFCPACLSEYREGITHCDECDRDLVAQITPENVVHDVSEAKMVELRSFTNFSEAEMVQEVLEHNNIRSLVQGLEATGGLFPTPATAANLLVDERDLAKARELVDAYFEAEIVDEPVAEGGDSVSENG